MQTLHDWHARYRNQAMWTEENIAYTVNKAGLTPSSKIIEIGCGTGAMIEKFPEYFDIYGLDIKFESINFAKRNLPQPNYMICDAHFSAIQDNVFDLVFCHFLLLWVQNPEKVLKEMKRITKPGGYIAAFAEPDYSNRIDGPKEFIPLGKAQTRSLRDQGANPEIGNRLPSLFSSLDLENVEIGTYENSTEKRSDSDWDNEWEILEFDLKNSEFPAPLEKYKQSDRQSRKNKTRKLSIPTHFAIGSKRRKK